MQTSVREKEIGDVEAALYKSACGYEIEEETTEDDGSKIKRRIVKKHVPPNLTAAMFYLKNRCPARWQDHPKDAEDASVALVDVLLAELRGYIDADVRTAGEEAESHRDTDE